MTIDQLVEIVTKYGGTTFITCNITNERVQPENLEVTFKAPLIVSGILPGYLSIHVREKV